MVKKAMIEMFLDAQRVSVPLLAIDTADQAETVRTILAAREKFPIVQWDAARGITAVNKPGQDALAEAKIDSDDTIAFAEAMLALPKLPRRTIVFAHNAHRQLQSQEPLATATHVQAVSNLRDVLKLDFRMLVLLGPYVPIPTELAHDVVRLTHELPTAEDLATLIEEVYASPKVPLPKPAKAVVAKAVEAVSGLSHFEAEQVAAMSLGETDLDLDAMWERKRATIGQVPGLSVHSGPERFADLIGLDALKDHLRLQMRGQTPLGVVVWLDEIDKSLANTEGDSTGTRTDQVATLLTEMDLNEWRGFIGVGVSGGGKSLIAKTFGNEAGLLTIRMDVGGMLSKWVGDSEANLRQAIAIIKAVGRGHAYFIATSNGASVMRPELQRRFTDGIWMFDLMTDAERTAALVFYAKKYALTKEQQAGWTKDAMDGWTGAEVRNVCRYAWNAGCTLVAAAQFIVPMARSRAKEIERLRKQAHGSMLDASKGGPYQYVSEPMAKQLRAIELPTAVVHAIEKMPES